MKQSASRNCAFGAIVDEFPALAQRRPDVPAPKYASSRVDERRNRLLEINDLRMRVAQIEVMITDFDRTVTALEEAIRTEQGKTGIHDPARVEYSTCAKAMILRRDNLTRSIDRLKSQLVDLKIVLE